MVDISALMRVLPVSALEPNWVASLGGFIDLPKDRDWQERIGLLEPPAGQRTPYIEPLEALDKLLRRRGVAPVDAKARALEAVTRMKEAVSENRWVNFFNDLEPESPECLPLPDFVAWLRDERRRVNRLLASDLKIDVQGFKELASKEMLVSSDILDFFEQAAEVATSTPTFREPDNWDKPWPLETLPALPPPKAMIEFMPGPPWNDFGWGDWKTSDNPFLRWREAMRPIAQELETALGEPVYYFADLDCDTDDDDVHRFLVLHWCCTHKPESAFVRYLLKVSGATDVEELKAALIDPASYTHPFKMHCSFVGLETLCCHIDYLPPEAHKTVGVVFLTAQARKVAQSQLAQQIGAYALIVAPQELATDQWIKQATRYCRDWQVRYVFDGNLGAPANILLSVDMLCVIANEQTPSQGFDLKLSEQAEDLLWLALNFGIEAKYFHIDGTQLGNPETSLKRRGVPERVSARKKQCAAVSSPDITEKITNALTEEEVVVAFAKAWNRLEPDAFLALLAPDARYASQWVFEELVGSSAIAEYLRGKMQTVRAHSINDAESRVRVEIGRTTQGFNGRPCAFMTQGKSNAVQAAVLFEVENGKVARYDLCIPQILGAVRTGVFPI
jgi:hypothetical protein